jgi:2-methylcitrate dehydratase PrpD
MNKTISEVFSEFIVGQKFEDLPSEVIRLIKDHILDTTGATLAAHDQDSAQIVTDYVRSLGGKEESTIIAYGDKLPAQNAAMANGVLGHGLEINDYYFHGGGHPGPFVYPPALALGEKQGVDGKTIMLAILVGYEISIRLGSVMRKGAASRGFHPTTICGVFGATAAAGKVLGLSVKQMMNALALTGSQMAGLRSGHALATEIDTSLKKPFHAGWACHSGVIAAELVKRGYTAEPSAIFEGRRGLLRAYADVEIDDVNVIRQRLLTNLGVSFELPKVSYKTWPAAGGFQAALEASAAVANLHNISADDIEEVTVATHRTRGEAIERLETMMYEPTTQQAAQFAFPFQIAVAIVHRRPTVDALSERGLKNPKLLALARKVRFIPDHEAEAVFPLFNPATVSIRVRDGSVHSEHKVVARGDYPILLTKEEMRNKFTTLASRALPLPQVEEIIKAVDSFEDIQDIRHFAPLLGKDHGPTSG